MFWLFKSFAIWIFWCTDRQTNLIIEAPCRNLKNASTEVKNKCEHYDYDCRVFQLCFNRQNGYIGCPSKHLPSIALLPFYQNQSMDASNIVCAKYVKLGHKCTNILKDEADWAKNEGVRGQNASPTLIYRLPFRLTFEKLSLKDIGQFFSNPKIDI